MVAGRVKLLFKKMAMFTDIHWGKHADSAVHNADCVRFMEWFLEQAAARECDTVCFMGDWHHSRSKIGVETLNYSKAGLDLLAAYPGTKYFVIGNHDMPFLDTRRIDSLPFLDSYSGSGVVPVREPTLLGGCLFLPYLVGSDNRVELAEMASRAKYVFGHLELPGFLYNGGHPVPEGGGRLGEDELRGPDYVFSGHLHIRQARVRRAGGEVHYIGNCFPHDFSDAGDTARGMCVLEWGGAPEYINWPEMPTYRYVEVEDLPDVVGSLGQRDSVRVRGAADMSREERDELAAEVASACGASVVFEAAKPSASEASSVDPTGKDIDTVVIEWLSDPNNCPGLDSQKLVELYLSARN